MAQPNEQSAQVDAYILQSAPGAAAVLRKIRQVIRKAAPEATEVISYRMPAFKGRGMLLYYGAFKKHIGIYPPIRGNAALRAALKKYAGPGGNLRFPLDQPIPYGLIARIAKHQVKQDAAKFRRKR